MKNSMKMSARTPPTNKVKIYLLIQLQTLFPAVLELGTDQKIVYPHMDNDVLQKVYERFLKCLNLNINILQHDTVSCILYLA